MPGNSCCVIIGASADVDELGLCAWLSENPKPFVICADGGVKNAARLGIAPDLFIGDCDSSCDPDIENRIVLSPEKDVSDMQAAVDYALDRGFERILMTGCLGGRADHHFANMCLLERIYNRGGTGEAAGKCAAAAVKGNKKIREISFHM